MNNQLVKKEDLIACFKALGIKEGSIVYITGNITKLGIPISENGAMIASKNRLLEFYMNSILDVVGENGTLVFPTHTWDEINRIHPFNPAKSRCKYPLSEYLRVNLNSKRQLHPFASISASGKYKDYIVNENLQFHPYNYESPMAMLEKTDCIYLSIGMPISDNYTPVHYCEFICGVPYRYTKGFIKELIWKDTVVKKEFYLYVCYRQEELVRDKNKKIFATMNDILSTQRLGSGIIQAVSLKKAIRATKKLMLEDPYIWLREYSKSSSNHAWNI
jgi:aminoglycoside 3-N-acetyltransferase